jgi:hypothetical protein
MKKLALYIGGVDAQPALPTTAQGIILLVKQLLIPKEREPAYQTICWFFFVEKL